MGAARPDPQAGRRPARSIAIEPGPLRLTLRGRGRWPLAARSRSPPGRPAELLAVSGQVPLPPYIRKGRAAAADRERYQTVYARRAGSVAAPTAGLHFTPEVLDRLRPAASGGPASRCTSASARSSRSRPTTRHEHAMHREWCEVPAATVDAIRACAGARRAGRGGRHDDDAGAGDRRPAAATGDPWRGRDGPLHPPAVPLPRASTGWSPTSTCRGRRCCCWSPRSPGTELIGGLRRGDSRGVPVLQLRRRDAGALSRSDRDASARVRVGRHRQRPQGAGAAEPARPRLRPGGPRLGPVRRDRLGRRRPTPGRHLGAQGRPLAARPRGCRPAGPAPRWDGVRRPGRGHHPVRRTG